MLLATDAVQLFRHQNFKKRCECWDVLFFLTYERAWRHSGVRFDGHLNFKKWSEPVSFLTFSLTHVLGATAPCHFSTSQVQKVLRMLTMFCTFSLKSVLLATAACNCIDVSSAKSAPRPDGVLYMFTHDTHVLLATAACGFWYLLWAHGSAPAALTSLLFDWLRNRRIIEKTQRFWDVL